MAESLIENEVWLWEQNVSSPSLVWSMPLLELHPLSCPHFPHLEFNELSISHFLSLSFRRGKGFCGSEETLD